MVLQPQTTEYCTMKTNNQILLEELNKAFARNDTEFITEKVTDNIKWTIVGDQTIEGKEAFVQALKNMAADEPMKLTIHNIITHGKEAAVDGIMKQPNENKTYAFCDVYKFSGFKNPKITEMTSYVIEVKE